MGASGVDGRWVFSATLTNELIEPMAEVLHLACSQDAAHSHQLGMVVTTSWSWVGMATSSQCPLLDLWSLSRSCPCQACRGHSHSWSRLVSHKTRQPFWGLAGDWWLDSDVGLASWRWGYIPSLVIKLVEEVQPEEERQIRWKAVQKLYKYWSFIWI